MKNKIAIILTLQFIITVFVFSGCGESTASSNSSKLTYCAYKMCIRDRSYPFLAAYLKVFVCIYD